MVIDHRELDQIGLVEVKVDGAEVLIDHHELMIGIAELAVDQVQPLRQRGEQPLLERLAAGQAAQQERDKEEAVVHGASCGREGGVPIPRLLHRPDGAAVLREAGCQ